MSFEYIRAAFAVTNCRPNAKFVLVALADHADKDGYCFPSLRHLGKKCSVSKTTMVKRIAYLELNGFIDVDRGKHFNRYSLNIMVNPPNKMAAYERYLTTPHWKQLRREAFKRDGYKCCKCGAKRRIQAHHLEYAEDLRDVPLKDIQTLCVSCHKKTHDELRSKQNGNGNHLKEPFSPSELKLWLDNKGPKPDWVK